MYVDDPDPTEADAVADLWVELARDQRAYGSHLLAEANRAAVRETAAARIAGGGVLLARTAGDEAVGFVMFGPELGSYENDTERWVVQNLYVRPAHRDRGVGSDLLAAAEAEMVDRGAEAVAVEAMAANRDALRFYRRAGFDAHRVQLEKRPESDTLTRDG
jgi:ribosomal protein S18 acetylase RimI-like enzyme